MIARISIDVNCNLAVYQTGNLTTGETTGVTTCPAESADPVVYLPACDVDDDGYCTDLDAAQIVQCAAGLAAPLCPRNAHTVLTLPTPPTGYTPTIVERVTYTLDGRPVAAKVSGHPNADANGVFYLHLDHLGSVVGMTDTSGALVDGSTARFYPFGRNRQLPRTRPGPGPPSATGATPATATTTTWDWCT